MKPAFRLSFVTLLLVAAGLGIYVWRERSRLGAQRQDLEIRLATVRGAIDRTRREQETAERDLAVQLRAAQDAAAVAAATAAPPNPAMVAWEKKVATLRALLARHREWAIPEIDLLSPDEFIFFARDAQFDTDEAQRKALRDLRGLAKRKVAPMFRDALDEYVATNGGRLPADMDELARFIRPPLPATVLARYALTGRVALSGGGGEEFLLYERMPVDELYDTRHVLGTRMSVQLVTNPEVYVFTRALAAYESAHAGRKPTQPAELGPYLEATLDAPTLARYFDGWQKDPANLQDPAKATMRPTGSVMMFRPIGGPREPKK